MPDAAAKGACKANGLPSGALVTVDVAAVQPQWMCQSGAGSKAQKQSRRVAAAARGSRQSPAKAQCLLADQISGGPQCRVVDEHKIRGDGVGSPLPAPPPDARRSPAQGSRRTLQGPARRGKPCIASSRRACVGGSGAALAGRWWWWCAGCSQAGPRLAKGPRRFRRTGRAGLVAVPLTHLVQDCLLQVLSCEQRRPSISLARLAEILSFERPSSMNQRGCSAPRAIRPRNVD